MEQISINESTWNGFRKKEIILKNPREHSLYSFIIYPNITSNTLIHYIPGYSSHITSFLSFGSALLFLKRGYIISGIDFEGHGKSEGLRGFVSNYNHLVEDQSNFILFFKKYFSDIKNIYMFGHSMGGLISFLSSLKLSNEISGTILMSPLFVTTTPMSAVRTVMQPMKLFSSIFPMMKLPLNFNTNNYPEDYRPYIKRMKEDKYAFRENIRLRSFFQIEKMLEEAIRRVCEFNNDLILFHGMEDCLTCYKGTEWVYKIVKSKKKKMVFIERCNHNPLINSSKDLVISMIRNFIQSTPSE